MKKVCLILFLCLMAAAAQADITATPHFAGDFNGWDPGLNPMTETGVGTGIWEFSISGLAADQYQQFKITDGTWDENKPAANSWYYADGSGDVTVSFDTNFYADGWLSEQFRIGLSTDPGTWSLVGDHNGWNNADPTQVMTDDGGGIYSLTQTFAAGDYNLKPVVTGSWDGIGTEARSIDAWNYWLSLPSASEVTVSVDAFSGTMKVDVIPEPATMALLAMGGLGLLRRKRG